VSHLKDSVAEEYLRPIVLSDTEEGPEQQAVCGQRNGWMSSLDAANIAGLGSGSRKRPRPSVSSALGSDGGGSECGDLVFEDDDSCEEFIPSGALRGAAASAALLHPPVRSAPASPRPLPGALRAMLPTDRLSAPREVAAADLLTGVQSRAVQLVAREAREKSRAAEAKLEERLRRWGYAPGTLAQVLSYIRDEAPIVIHLDLAARLDKLMRDTHYRNQFETGCTRGSSDLEKRKTWEDRLFQGIYEGAPGFDRVKYGVLNAVNDPRGISTVAKQYGLDYIVLRGVRLRTTFSDRDSCNQGQLASCEWYAHVLEKYNDLELRAVVEVALGERLFADSAVLDTAAGGYKEVQIHGEVRLSQHLEAVVMHPSHVGTPLETSLQAWCRRLGVRLERMPGSGAGAGQSDLPAKAVNSTKAKKRREAARPSTVPVRAPLWQWGPRERQGPWLRFDAFASAALEERRRDDSETLPAFPGGTIISADLDAMELEAFVAGERARLALRRCSGPFGEPAAPSQAPRRAQVPEEPTAWEWCASASGRSAWTEYSTALSALLEAAFREGRREVGLTISDVHYRVNLEHMEQTNCTTRYRRCVRRRSLR